MEMRLAAVRGLHCGTHIAREAEVSIWLELGMVEVSRHRACCRRIPPITQA